MAYFLDLKGWVAEVSKWINNTCSMIDINSNVNAIGFNTSVNNKTTSGMWINLPIKSTSTYPQLTIERSDTDQTGLKLENTTTSMGIFISGSNSHKGLYHYADNEYSTNKWIIAFYPEDNTVRIPSATTISSVTTSSTLTVTGASTLNSTLSVSGATTLSSTLTVSGASTTSGLVSALGVDTIHGFQVKKGGGAISTSNPAISLMIGSGGINRGLYDNTTGKWLLCGNNSAQVSIPTDWYFRYNGQVLYTSTGSYLGDGQSATLNHTALDFNAIVLVWSRYDVANSTSLEYGWQFTYIPRWQIANHSSAGVRVNLTPYDTDPNSNCVKYFYVKATEITGHADNVAHGTGYDNRLMVLRAVIGV